MNRKYLTTHPWINFQIDLRMASPRFWINAGEAKSKCEHIEGVPLKPGVAQILHQIYVAKGIQGTTAIEGNTLTEEEVRQYLEGKLKSSASQQHLVQEIHNIASACNQIAAELIGGNDAPITPELLRKFNALILKDLPLEENVKPGEIRNHSVGVRTYLAPPAEDCDYLLSRLCEWMQSQTFSPASDSDEFVYAVVKAVVFHIYLAWIHPFGDGNGRTARLVELSILLSSGISMPASHLLSDHYNRTRKQYYAELERASKSGGNIIPFIEYAMQGFVDGLRGQLQLIRVQQLGVAWTAYIDEKFAENRTISGRRQRCLARDLMGKQQGVPLIQIQELTPQLAKAYASKTIRTVQRDVKELEKLGLVRRSDTGEVFSNLGAISAFLPNRKIKQRSPLQQQTLPSQLTFF